MNGVPPDHNAARWLTVKYLAGLSGGGDERRDGWHVVRVCPCHWGESVTLALPSKEWAEDVRDVMLSVTRMSPLRGTCVMARCAEREADAIVAACEAWPSVSGYVPCHYKQGCSCEMVPARVRAAIAAMGRVTVPTPPASDLERANALVNRIGKSIGPRNVIWPEHWRQAVAAELVAVRAEAKAEQHAADVVALRNNMHLFLPIHEGMDVVRRVADFLEKRGLSVSS